MMMNAEHVSELRVSHEAIPTSKGYHETAHVEQLHKVGRLRTHKRRSWAPFVVEVIHEPARSNRRCGPRGVGPTFNPLLGPSFNRFEFRLNRIPRPIPLIIRP